jgi:hypothetical protein
LGLEKNAEKPWPLAMEETLSNLSVPVSVENILPLAVREWSPSFSRF